MNIAIIGKNSRNFAEIGYKTYDSLQIVAYANAAQFMDAISVRNIEIHRMLLTQDGIEDNVVSQDELNSFIDTIERVYPSMKLVTFSKDKAMCSYLAQVFNSSNYVHFCVEGIKVSAKLIIDALQQPIPELVQKYDKIIYHKEIVVDIEERIESIDYNSTEADENSNVPGYVQPQVPEKDNRTLIKKLFGMKPKQKTQLTNNNFGKPIGQGQGVEEFSQNSGFYPGDDVNGNEQGNSEYEGTYNIFMGGGNDVGLGMGYDEPKESDSPENLDYNKFENNIFENDISPDVSEIPDVPEIPEIHDIPDISDVPESSFFDNNGYSNENEEIESLKPMVDINKEDEFEKPSVDLDKNDGNIFEVPEISDNLIEFEKPEDINIPMVDIDSMKRNISNFNFEVVQPQNTGPVVPNLDLDTIGDTEVDLFGDNLESIMQSYEESNQKIVERVVEVEKIVHVGSANATSFRNKNGVRIIIVTGDRRIGSTKLALNLANLYSKREKVLYVDFDRYRHGSLGYLNLDEILNEPEHVQDGVTHLKSANILPQVVHFNRKGGFYSLTSMYGSPVLEEDIKKAQQALVMQKEFSTVIVDCPLDTIGLLSDLVRCSTTLICAEDDYVGIINLLNMLMGCAEDSDLAVIYERSHFVVGRRGNVDKFLKCLAQVVDLFGLDESAFDWSNVDVLGTIRGTQDLANRME